MSHLRRTPFIAGNWKMHLARDEAVALAAKLAGDLKDLPGVEVMIAPPFTNLSDVGRAIKGSPLQLGAQNMHWESKGAFTGEVSGDMLRSVGCSHVILGHSERRHLFGETSAMVDRKVQAALETGLVPIVCIGETLDERRAGATMQVIEDQLQGSLAGVARNVSEDQTFLIAYEPVWAIGTGMTATPAQAQEVHAFIRRWMESGLGSGRAAATRILYGGSVKPDNAAELMREADIDGALVGGASLEAASFTGIVRFDRL